MPKWQDMIIATESLGTSTIQPCDSRTLKKNHAINWRNYLTHENNSTEDVILASDELPLFSSNCYDIFIAMQAHPHPQPKLIFVFQELSNVNISKHLAMMLPGRRLHIGSWNDTGWTFFKMYQNDAIHWSLIYIYYNIYIYIYQWRLVHLSMPD